MDLNSVWDDLKGSYQSATAGYLRRRVFPTSPCSIYFALQKPDGRFAFLIDCSARAVPVRVDWPTGRGFECYPEPVVPGPDGTVRIILTPTEDQAAELFKVLCLDLARHVASGKDERQGIGLFLKRMEHWQKFLNRHPHGLSPEARQGLYAELYLLNTLLSTLEDLQNPIRAWTGPDASSHDFHFGAVAIEVKSSASAHAPELKISSIIQLDDTGGSLLFLYFLGLEAYEQGTDTLPNLVDGIRKALSSDSNAGHMFEERLLDAGYCDAHAWRYQSTSYRVTREEAYRVAAGFPRLIPGIVPQGITEVRYSVSLAACAPYAVDTSTLYQEVLASDD